MDFVYGSDIPEYDDTNATNYCDKYLYLFSFWFINSTIIVFTSVLTILIILSLIIWLILIPLSYFSCKEFNRSLNTRISNFFNRIYNIW